MKFTHLTLKTKALVGAVSVCLLGSVFFFQNCSHDTSNQQSQQKQDRLADKAAAAAAGTMSCAFNGEEILSGDSIVAYVNPSGNICQSEIRTCANGVLSGSYAYANCVIDAPKACLFNGLTVPHGQQVQAFLNSTGTTCTAEMRSCNNGVLSGSYQYSSCTVNTPPSCLFNGQTIESGSSTTAFQNPTVPYGQTCVSEIRYCNYGSMSGSFQYGSCAPEAPAACIFNGQTIAHGQDVIGFQNSTVPYGSNCQSQVRTCDNGSLSGSFAYANCNVNAAANCLFDGQTVAHGQAVTAWQNSSVPFGQQCVNQARSCDNGVLTGTYQYANCTNDAAASCLFNGQTIAHGEVVFAFLASSVPYGQSCTSQARGCYNGALSGSYSFASCTVDAPKSCLFNGQTIANGQSVTTFLDSSVPYGSTCQSEVRTCNDGVMSGSYNNAACVVDQPMSCDFNGNIVANGQKVVAFETATVAFGSTCNSEDRTCDNGDLSGSFAYGNCNVDAPKTCLFNGRTMAHGESVIAYITSKVAFGQTCGTETRTCSNGTLSGAAQYASCVVDQPASCLLDGKTIAHGASIKAYLSQTHAPGVKCASEKRKCTNGTLSGTGQYLTCPVQVPTTKWINSKDGETQKETCKRVGLKAAASTGTGMCASGENRPANGEYGWNKISYRHGTSGKAVAGGIKVISRKADKKVYYYCMRSGQKPDYDKTDQAVAYLCKK